jgi:hypothetical protein
MKITSQHKGSHSGAEAGEESVEWKRAHQTAIDELNDSREKDVEHVCVDQLEPERTII